MTELITLHSKLGSHQELSIIYVVDGYQAILYEDDNFSNKTESGVSETITLALQNLEIKLNQIEQIEGRFNRK